MYLARANTVVISLKKVTPRGKRPGHNVADAIAVVGTARLQGPGTQS